jgi:hypothetical protein
MEETQNITYFVVTLVCIALVLYGMARVAGIIATRREEKNRDRYD